MILKKFILLLFPLTIFSQIKELSLKECIRLANENNIKIRNQNHQISKLKNNIDISKGLFLPDLIFNASQNYNLGNSFNVSTGVGQIESSSSIFGLSSSVTLFEGQRKINALKYSKLNKNKATIDLEKIKLDLELLVTNDYLQALLYKEAITTTENQLSFSKQQLTRVERLFKNNITSKKELLENQSLVQTDLKNNIIASVNYQNALIKIGEHLSLEKIENIMIKDLDVSSIKNHFLLEDTINSTKNLEQHPIIITSKTDIELQELQLKIKKSSFLPNLRFNYQYGSSYYHILGENDLVFNALTNEFENNNFWKQLNNNKLHYLNFSLNVPIFNRFATRSIFKKSKSDIDIAKLNFIQNKKLLTNKLEAAYNDMIASKAIYDSNMLTVQFQKEIFKTSTEQYEAGIISIYNFVDSKNRYLNTQSAYLKSKYEYLLKIKILEFYIK